MSVIEFKPPSNLYTAKAFTAQTAVGPFGASGTICGHIDIIGPFQGTYCLSPDEVESLIIMLKQARGDVLDNANPNGDPRLFDMA